MGMDSISDGTTTRYWSGYFSICVPALLVYIPQIPVPFSAMSHEFSHMAQRMNLSSLYHR